MKSKKENIEQYGQEDHVFRYAAWAASTAAGASQKCRFKVSKGVVLLKEADLEKLAKGFHYLKEVSEFDIWHDEKHIKYQYLNKLKIHPPKNLSKKSSCTSYKVTL